MKKIIWAVIPAVAAMMPFQSTAEDGIDVGGTIRANYIYKSYSDSSEDKLGDLAFDMVAIKFSGELNGFGLASEYRFYEGWKTLRYGYVSYDFNPELSMQFGVNKVPFGNEGYISNSFWTGIPYYIGLEDDYDMGVKLSYTHGKWKTDAGFYKNSEFSASNPERYSTDLYTGTTNGTEYNNEETNQFNLRQAYHFDTNGWATKLGASVEVGQIYNNVTGNNGDRYAVALHLDSSYNGWNVQLQAMEYEYDAADATDPNKIGVSMFNWAYEVASKAQIYNFNIAKTVSTSWGSVKFYNDFGILTPDTDDSTYEDSLQNVTGMAISSGPVYTMFDFIVGKNMYASGVNNHVGLAQNDSGWDNRININLGYYF